MATAKRGRCRLPECKKPTIGNKTGLCEECKAEVRRLKALHDRTRSAKPPDLEERIRRLAECAGKKIDLFAERGAER
jgi:hypothetical protein